MNAVKTILFWLAVGLIVVVGLVASYFVLRFSLSHSGSALFWLFAIMTCGGAVSVAVSQNVVRMAFSLVLTLGSTAVLFLLLGADFVGATQLLVYVGGTLVLLVFGVMLTATGPFTRIKSSAADGILSGLIGVIFLFIVASTVTSVRWVDSEKEVDTEKEQGLASKIDSNFGTKKVGGGFNPKQQGNTTRQLGLSFLSIRTDRELVSEDPNASAKVGYLLPFEIVSVHLLVVLVGAAYLARTKRRTKT